MSSKLIYVASAVIGAVLTVVAARYAYAERGYFAIGGEYAFLMLPFFVAVFKHVIKDMFVGGGK